MIKKFFFCVLISCYFATIAAAEPVILTVQNADNKTLASFTEADIRALPAVTIETFDPWDNIKRTYTGCALLSLIEEIDSKRTFDLVEIVAKNDYKASLTKDELKRHNYILSYDMDGTDYSNYTDEDKGPLAIAVDYDQVPEAEKLKIKNQLVWWISKIIIK